VALGPGRDVVALPPDRTLAPVALSVGQSLRRLGAFQVLPQHLPRDLELLCIEALLDAGEAVLVELALNSREVGVIQADRRDLRDVRHPALLVHRRADLGRHTKARVALYWTASMPLHGANGG
jgi:hypothetical protein